MGIEQHARVAFTAYGDSTGGKTWDGRDIPEWDQLPENIRAAWRAAAATAILSALDPIVHELAAAAHP